MSPSPATTVFGVGDSLTLTGSVRVGAGERGGATSLLLYFVQRAPTKWTRYGKQLFGFTKVVVPDGGEAAFALVARVKDLEAWEPATGDYEVQSGVYELFLGGDVSGGMAFAATFNVSGSYTWAWDFTK